MDKHKIVSRELHLNTSNLAFYRAMSLHKLKKIIIQVFY
jgi:hypothetical protein